jgi:hypothetical protein
VTDTVGDVHPTVAGMFNVKEPPSMMYIASVDSSLGEDELILEITDGVFTCRAFCYPCRSSVGDMIDQPLSSLDVVGVRRAFEPGSMIKQSSRFDLWVCGQLINRRDGIIAVGGLRIAIGGNTIPGDVDENDWIECEILRLDLCC